MSIRMLGILTVALLAGAGIWYSAGAAPFADAALASTDTNHITVYQSPTCGCCGMWIEHLREEGFHVEVVDRPDMMTVKAELKVPGELSSCHTGVVAGRVVEGHVPADAIRAFLETEGEAVGIAVPGMPVGAPGMEVEGREPDAYDIITFDRQGNTAVFQRR